MQPETDKAPTRPRYNDDEHDRIVIFLQLEALHLQAAWDSLRWCRRCHSAVQALLAFLFLYVVVAGWPVHPAHGMLTVIVLLLVVGTGRDVFTAQSRLRFEQKRVHMAYQYVSQIEDQTPMDGMRMIHRMELRWQLNRVRPLLTGPTDHDRHRLRARWQAPNQL